MPFATLLLLTYEANRKAQKPLQLLSHSRSQKGVSESLALDYHCDSMLSQLFFKRVAGLTSPRCVLSCQTGRNVLETMLFVAQGFGGENFRGGGRRIQRRQQGNAERYQRHNYAVLPARGERQIVDRVDLRRQGNEAVMPARPRQRIAQHQADRCPPDADQHALPQEDTPPLRGTH